MGLKARLRAAEQASGGKEFIAYLVNGGLFDITPMAGFGGRFIYPDEGEPYAAFYARAQKLAVEAGCNWMSISKESR